MKILPCTNTIFDLWITWYKIQIANQEKWKAKITFSFNYFPLGIRDHLLRNIKGRVIPKGLQIVFRLLLYREENTENTRQLAISSSHHNFFEISTKC